MAPLLQSLTTGSPVSVNSPAFLAYMWAGKVNPDGQRKQSHRLEIRSANTERVKVRGYGQHSSNITS